MKRKHAALRFLALAAVAALSLVAVLRFPARGGDPGGAFYSPANDRIFWFVHFSDAHIGDDGSADQNNLHWLVSTARSVIGPEFMVATGDLTDSTNGNIFGYPNGPHQAEWDEYKSIVDPYVDASFYYDLPGNHDAYGDQSFAYYRANSVQGRATGGTQISWTREFPFGKYHFLGLNSADNTGAPFSIFFPYGDHAGLDATELAFVNAELNARADANLTMAFGHHPVTATGSSSDTYLFYGQQGFIGSLDSFAASLYGYGHTHASSDVQFTGDSYTGFMNGGGIRYLNIDALGKDSPCSYEVVAVDCDGVSSVSAEVGQWPVVLITAPVARTLGGTANPYSYSVPAAPDNPVRALVFDQGVVSAVEFRVGFEAVWHPMTRVAGNPRLWQGVWNASACVTGDYILAVRAVGTSTRSQAITVTVDATGDDTVEILAASYTAKTKRLHVEATSTAQPDAVLTVVGYGPMTWSGSIYVLDKRIAGSPGDHVTVTSDRGGIDDYYFEGGSNQPPVAYGQTVAVLKDTAKAVTLTASDPNGDPLAYLIVSQPAHGTLTGTAPNLTYTPAPGFEGEDGFTFKANDGQIDGNTAAIAITVSASMAEEVVILRADYRAKSRQLTVEATSSFSPGVTMTLVGYGAMTYDATQDKYVFTKKVTPAPATVTVTSSAGGSATSAVKNI